MARSKKPKVQIKRQKTSLGWAYRIYIEHVHDRSEETPGDPFLGERMAAITTRYEYYFAKALELLFKAEADAAS